MDAFRMKPCLHKVQYYETDMMGVTHHANYIRWMEEARIDFMDQLGFPYRSMEAKKASSTSADTRRESQTSPFASRWLSKQ